MRKQSKSLLSMILTAAMVVSLGAGVTGEKSKAADQLRSHQNLLHILCRITVRFSMEQTEL